MDDKGEQPITTPNTIVVQCYPYGELIYIVKSVGEKLDKLDESDLNNINGVQLNDVVNEMDVNNMNDAKVNATTLNNWKWNYLHDNVTQRNEIQNKMVAKETASENSSKLLPTEHSFCKDFDEFALSLMQKENPEYMNLQIRETDLLETDDSDKTGDYRETSITGSDEEDVKETDLTGISDDELTDVSSLSSLTTIGRSGLSLNRLNSSFISIPNSHENGNSDIFGITPQLELNKERRTSTDSNNDDKSGSKSDHGDNVKFQDLESDYFETDCETMDSGIFPNADCRMPNAEYFQDIGSDFFDDEGDDENENENDVTEKSSQLLRTKKKREKKTSDSNSLSPVSPLPPGKTASISNSLLRSTISELERALGDSNKLLAKRDAKMQIIRNRNIELKKTLAKELETNTKMKHMLVEKDKVILEKQTKIIALNQEIHDINDKLSKLRLNRLNEIHSSAPVSEKLKLGNLDTSFDEKLSVNGDVDNVKTPTKNDVTVTTPTTPGCKSSNRRSFCRNNSRHDTTPESDNKCIKNNNENINHNNSAIIKKDDVNNSDNCNQGNELQANLRIKFLRDAFFYYMIGFHPDEQINAILAILEYGDRRQEFVLEAHNMKKTGKKFNVSKVSSRAHSFVQEEFH